MRKDSETLALCDRFFDAIERGDYETLESCYAPEAVVWHSHDCLYQPRGENLAMLKAGMGSLRKMEFADRRVRTFEGGFVQQHRLYVTRENGFIGQMDVCFVAYVRDGRISRIYEYFDTGQREKFLGPQGAAAAATQDGA
jgi:ketosteroid isomerase-like protein